MIAIVRKLKIFSLTRLILSEGTSNNMEIKGASTPVSNAISALEEDNGKPMDALIDDTGKKVEVHYFDMDDMKFDDMRHAIEEAEYENAYSENG
ncbi:hypothetical protein Tco_0996052 [Tanacetum coccineum]